MERLSPINATQNGSSTYILPYSGSIRSRKMLLYIMGNTMPPTMAVATSAKGIAFGFPYPLTAMKNRNVTSVSGSHRMRIIPMD